MADTTLVTSLSAGWTVYTQITNAAGEIWNGSAYVTYSVGSWATYATSTPETSTGVYTCQFPLASPVDQYTWTVYRQLGASPASTDPAVSQPVPLYTWDGTTLSLGTSGGGGSTAGQPVATASETLSQAIGVDRSYDFTVRDDDGNPITTYTGDETLTCSIWSGQDQASLATPDAAWLIVADGTVRVAVTPADTASLAPGLYRMSVTLTSGPAVTLIFDGSIDLTSAPGATAAPLTYCSFEDMKLYAPQVQNLQDTRTDLAGFLANRARARAWTDEHCLDGYRPNYGRARRYVSPDGLSSGPHLRWVTAGPDGAPTPTLAELKAVIAAGGLQVTALIREANAHMAAAIVYLNQPGSNNPYHQNGAYHAAKAAALLGGSVIEIDLDDDAAPDVRIGQDVTWLT